MKRIILLIFGFLLVINCGCGPIARKSKIEANWRDWQNENASFATIKQSSINRGYLTIDEFQTAFSILTHQFPSNPYYILFEFYPPGTLYYPFIQKYRSDECDVICQEASLFFIDVINKDLLPFKPMFYLSLEKENYDEAELIRRNWVYSLNYLKYFFEVLESCSKKRCRNDFIDNCVRNREIAASESCWRRLNTMLQKNNQTIQKVQFEIEKINIVGLTDPMLVTLRKELKTALQNKRWDEVGKIQNIITARVKELTPPPQPQVIERIIERGSGGQATVFVQQPSELNLKVEQIPRYGATDIGRAISILDGKGGRLDPKAEGTLKLMDILLKR